MLSHLVRMKTFFRNGDKNLPMRKRCEEERKGKRIVLTHKRILFFLIVLHKKCTYEKDRQLN